MDKKTLNISPILETYKTNVNNELEERWNKWPKNLMENSIYEVIGGILSRQTSLSLQMAQNMNIWNEEIAPIILRSMADTHINLAWILINPKEHSEKFILHGLGQLKLDLEHRKNSISEENEEMKEALKLQEEFINSQQYTFLTDVNLGSWSGLSTRKMAQDSGLIDFYNLVYQPFSGCSHSTWAHISKYNLTMSKNPLHRFLKKPIVMSLDPHIDYMQLAAKYLEKSFKAFDEKYNLDIKIESSFENLINDFNDILNTK